MSQGLLSAAASAVSFHMCLLALQHTSCNYLTALQRKAPVLTMALRRGATVHCSTAALQLKMPAALRLADWDLLSQCLC